MRARFIWHKLERIKPDGDGFSFTVEIKSQRPEYASAANLVDAIKRQFRTVKLLSTAYFSTIGNDKVFAFTICCHHPKIVSLPARNTNDSLKAA
jgi:hypothetical protein